MNTIPALLERQRIERGNAVCLHDYRGESFVAITWQQLFEDVLRFAAALHSLGVKPGDRVMQVSENRYEWIVLDLAVHACQAVHVAVHATLTGPQVVQQIVDCEPMLVVSSTVEQTQKLFDVTQRLPDSLKIVSHELIPAELAVRNQPILQLSFYVHENSLASGQQLFSEALEQLTASSLATILYTSGTTGEPKGVMLSHGNLSSNARACAEALQSDFETLRLCWLPLSHIYARTSDLYCWLTVGSQLALARSRETIIADCASVHPTFVNGVPYFYDKVVRHLRTSGQLDQPGALQQLLGGNIRACCAGGAPLSDETARVFEKQGVLLVQGYGLTEASPVIATCSRQHQQIGTVGPPVPGVEVCIAADGEVLTRGPHVMLGYWNKPQATAEVIADGWLHTGDLGTLEDGFLKITGRKKELIVLTSGKKISPAFIEGLLTDDLLIAQAVVVGDNQNYLTALIAPDPDALRAEIIQRHIAVNSPAEALNSPEVRKLYQEKIAARLVELSPQEQIGKFTLIDRAFSIEKEEMTASLKLKRRQITANFAEQIAAMYA